MRMVASGAGTTVIARATSLTRQTVLRVGRIRWQPKGLSRSGIFELALSLKNVA